MSRPNSFSFDLKRQCISTASSGYNSAEPSTEHEYAPFDWDRVNVKLEALASDIKVATPTTPLKDIAEVVEDLGFAEELEEEHHEDRNDYVTMFTDDPVQYTMADSFFTVEVNSWMDAFDEEDFDGCEEAWVVGPSGQPYEVIMERKARQESKFVSRRWTQFICKFRSYECGQHTCQLRMKHPRFKSPPPLSINISRKYQDSSTLRAIVTADIEISRSDTCLEVDYESRKPWGICSNTRTEQVIVADREEHTITVFGPDGGVDFTFGKEGKGPGEFFRPTAVAYDAVRDRILVADKDNHRIQIFSPQGEFISTFGRKGRYQGQFFFPWGLTVSKDGKYIAVADSRNHRIQLFDADGQFLRKFGLKDNSSHVNFKQEFDYPRGLCFDNEGEYLYVTDFNLHNLLKIDINFTRYEKVLTPRDLKRPQGVTVDEAGNILVCDSRNDCIKVLSPDGKIITSIDKLGIFGDHKDTKFQLPLDITLLKGGFLGVLDMNGRIRVF